MPVSLQQLKRTSKKTGQVTVYLRAIQAFRNAKGKPDNKVVYSWGNLEKAKKQDPNILETAQKWVDDWNAKEKADRYKERVELGKKLLMSSKVAPELTPVVERNIAAPILKQFWRKLDLEPCFLSFERALPDSFPYKQSVELLVQSRILQPASKLRTFACRMQSVQDFGCIHTAQTLYRTLDLLAKHKDSVLNYVNKALDRELGGRVTIACYDVTTYEFESQDDDGLLDFGISKKHMNNEVQVVMGLLVDQWGIPRDYQLFPGNTSEFPTMKEVVESFRRKYNVEEMIVVADRGLNSKDNLYALEQMGCKYVVAQRTSNLTEAEREQVLATDNWNTLPEPIDVDDDFDLRKHKEFRLKKKVRIPLEPPPEEPTNPDGPPSIERQRKYKNVPLESRLVVTYSGRRAKHDEKVLELKVKRCRKKLEKDPYWLNSRAGSGIIKADKTEKATIDQDAIDEIERWNGIYMISTNLWDKTVEEITYIYRQLWRIENCFRVSKTTGLKTRPVYVWKDPRIEGHFLSCFLALAIFKLMEHQFKQQAKNPEHVTAQKILTSLRDARLTARSSSKEVHLAIGQVGSLFKWMWIQSGLEPLTTDETEASFIQKSHLKQINVRPTEADEDELAIEEI